MSVIRVGTSVVCAPILAVALLGLGVSIAASSTVLDSAFIRSEVQRTDAYVLIFQKAKERVPSEASFLLPIIDEAESDLEPWAREQVTRIGLAAHDYVTGDGGFRAVLSLQEAKSYLMTRLQSMVEGSLPGGFPEVPAGQIEAFLDFVERQLDSIVPDSLVVDEAAVGEGLMNELRQSRRYAGYAATGSRVLPVVVLVMILAIAIVHAWKGRAISAYVGAAFCVAGIAGVVLTLIVRLVVPDAARPVVPAMIEPTIPGLVGRITEPLLLYGLVLLAIGIVLLFVAYRLLRTASR